VDSNVDRKFSNASVSFQTTNKTLKFSLYLDSSGNYEFESIVLHEFSVIVNQTLKIFIKIDNNLLLGYIQQEQQILLGWRDHNPHEVKGVFFSANVNNDGVFLLRRKELQSTSTAELCLY
jgi:hypothetical protein